MVNGFEIFAMTECFAVPHVCNADSSFFLTTLESSFVASCSELFLQEFQHSSLDLGPEGGQTVVPCMTWRVILLPVQIYQMQNALVVYSTYQVLTGGLELA